MLVLETGAFALRSQSLSFITPHNSFTSSFNASTSLNSARFFDVKQKQHTKSLFSSKSAFSLNHIHRKWNQPEHSSQHAISLDSRSLPQIHRTFSTSAHSPLPSTRQPLDVAVSATFTSMTTFCASSVESGCGPVLINFSLRAWVRAIPAVVCLAPSTLRDYHCSHTVWSASHQPCTYCVQLSRGHLMWCSAPGH